MTTLARTLLLFATLAAFTMAILPQPPQPPLLTSDKLQHVAAFSVLAALAALAFPKAPPLLPFLGLAVFGGLIELVQTIPAIHRDGDVFDWLADLAAGAVTLAMVELWRRRPRKGIRVPIDR